MRCEGVYPCVALALGAPRWIRRCCISEAQRVGILIVVMILFALTGIAAAVWGFVRPPPDEQAPPPEPPRKKEP
jgi:hypothetical protein